ncbi:Low affinity cationic amino acid transporter 2-like protein [Leptotrombidium deliense]|uniref:Low affinity cationic amino acid transporter 2-like protein n=1 Tax=Leptotrombidium deliense TaxID=299467 RepID=A0A443SKQ7_9ACAR|nr:Low affinity cationic amino acid transporter 2-like protein [Leptotrombidium deliense]
MNLKSLGKALIRKKKIDNSVSNSKLQRCLGTFDLTALGIGSTLGLGIYVLAGQVASKTAGPGGILSFLFAAIASVFAGLCYAEFGARVPKAGSAYVYSYVTVGEFIAFVIGWNLVLEYVIGTASVARGYSGYIDSLLNRTIENHLRELVPMDVYGFASYPDFLAFFITILLTGMLCLGVKESTRFNSIFTCLNLLVVVYVVVCGIFKADLQNWNLSKSEIPADAGDGGFMPWGFSGVMQGAATCFYGFIGFDVIATTGEEVKNPQKAIPISIVASLFCTFLAYFGVSGVQTLMWPYYDQHKPAPLPYVFEMVGWPIAKWFITIGALAGLSTSLLGAMFPLPRVLYAMASDGLIYRCFANVHPRFKTPLIATLLSGVFAGGMAAIFDVNELADMMSIGTLLAYSLVAVSVLILRYNSDLQIFDNSTPIVVNVTDDFEGRVATPEPKFVTSTDNVEQCREDEPMGDKGAKCVLREEAMSVKASRFQLIRQFWNLDSHVEPTLISSSVWLLILDVLLVTLEQDLFELKFYAIFSVLCAMIGVFIFTFALNKQPRNESSLSFKVPGVPFTPLLSVMINIYLMLKLSSITWIRFSIWMAIGMKIYLNTAFNFLSVRRKNSRTKHLYILCVQGNEVKPVGFQLSPIQKKQSSL